MTDDGGPLTEEEREILRLEQLAVGAVLRGNVLEARKLRATAALKRIDLLQSRNRTLGNGRPGDNP